MMRVLLDTHILLWAITEDKKFPAKADEIINNLDNEIYYSSISIWEVAIKRLKHPDKITNLSLQEFVSFCDDADFRELPLMKEHTYSLETLTRPDNVPPHNDPFDRILISQAKTEDMIFLTHDDNLLHYQENCILYV